MQDSANLKVLFVAGFGPIVRDTEESVRLYRHSLQGGSRRLSSHRGCSGRKDFCSMANYSSGPVLFWQRFLAQRHSCASSVA